MLKTEVIRESLFAVKSIQDDVVVRQCLPNNWTAQLSRNGVKQTGGSYAALFF